VAPVEDNVGIGQVLGDAGEERGAHVAGDVADELGVAAVCLEVGATGIAAAKVISNASNSNVNPDSGRAQLTATWRTPCSGQRTRVRAGAEGLNPLKTARRLSSRT
jgi:hypothetical protein